MLITDATNLPRIMACNGSRLLAATLPPTDSADTTSRDEGNAAHWAVQAVFKNEFTLEELADRKAPNGIYITPEMVEHIEDYLALIGTLGEIETNTTFGTDLWRVDARADHIWFNPNTLHINDFKYGWRIVEPENNWTMIAHAIGYCLSRQIVPARVRMTICQPRPHHPDGKSRTWEITYSDLRELYEQINTTLSNPSDTLQTGEHCRHCPSLPNCPAARLAGLNAIDASERAFDDQISDELLAYELDLLHGAQLRLENRMNALEELAKHRIKNGAIVPNYATEIQLTNRDWKAGIDVNFMLAITGKNLSKPKLVTPKQAEKAGVPEAVVKAFSERRPKGVKLVRRNANKHAEKMFGNGKESQ